MDLVGARGLTCPAPGPLCLGQQQLGSGGLPGHGLAVRPARLPRGVSVRPSVRPGDCAAAAPRREGGAWGRRRRVSAATSAPSEPARGLGTAGCTGGLGGPGPSPALPSRVRGSRRICPGRAVRGGGRRHRFTWARAAKIRGAGLCRGAGRRVTPLRRPWLAAAWTAGAPGRIACFHPRDAPEPQPRADWLLGAVGRRGNRLRLPGNARRRGRPRPLCCWTAPWRCAPTDDREWPAQLSPFWAAAPGSPRIQRPLTAPLCPRIMVPGTRWEGGRGRTGG